MRPAIASLMPTLVIGSLLGLSAPTMPAADLPRKAPDFALQTAQDKYIWLSEQEGKTVVLMFILTTCPHCQFTTGILSKLEKEYSPKGVVFLESAIEPMSSLHIPDFKAKFNVTFPVGYNDQGYVSKFLGRNENEPMFVPQLVVIDAKGNIQAQIGGDDAGFERPNQEAVIRAAIDKAIKAPTAAPERKVLRPSPAPVGAK